MATPTADLGIKRSTFHEHSGWYSIEQFTLGGFCFPIIKEVTFLLSCESWHLIPNIFLDADFISDFNFLH